MATTTRKAIVRNRLLRARQRLTLLENTNIKLKTKKKDAERAVMDISIDKHKLRDNVYKLTRYGNYHPPFVTPTFADLEWHI